MSLLGNRNKLGALLGMMFGGKRQLYDVFGYTKTVQYAAAYGKYNRQDIVARVIDAPAEALWTKPPQVVTGDAKWDEAWAKITAGGKIWSSIGRVDRLSGLGEYGVLLLGFDDAGSMDKPIRGGATKINYFQPYSIDGAKIDSFNLDPKSPDYMKPQIYNIQPVQESVTADKSFGKGFRADASRVLHVVENPLTNDVYGNSRIERIYNLTDDLLKIVGGTAETFWLTGNRGMQIDVDKEMELTKEDEKNLSDEIDDYQNQLRRVLRTRGVKVHTLGSDVPDPQNAFSMLISLISGATGIPKRILLGSEAGQLASEQDRNNWAERIMERRTSFGEPQIIRPLIHKLTLAGLLPEIDIGKVKIIWPDAFALSPLEKAQTSAQRARSAVNMSKAIDSLEIFTEDEAREILDLTPRSSESKTTKNKHPAKEANGTTSEEA